MDPSESAAGGDAASNSLLPRIAQTLGQLTTLIEADSAEDEGDVAQARFIREELDAMRARLATPRRSAALIGPIGVGKSSALLALTQLYVGEPPRSPREQQERAILTVGSGRTTAFPVTVRVRDDVRPTLRLKLIEMDERERVLLVFDVASLEIHRRKTEDDARFGERPDPVSEELRRAVLSAADYGEFSEKYFDGNLRRVRMIRPLDAVVGPETTPDWLRDHLLERMKGRTRTEWQFPNTEAGRAELRECYKGINQGNQPDATIPERVELEIPALPGVAAPLPLELIDTRGLDGRLDGRRDLQERLKAPEIVPVLLSSFANAPCPELLDVLKGLQRDPELRGARSRALILILDKGEAAGVVTADGDREIGQITRADQCWQALEQEQLTEGLDRTRLLVFDPLVDELTALRSALDQAIDAARAAIQESAERALRRAEALLSSDGNQRRLAGELDELLAGALRGGLPQGSPAAEPLDGLLTTMKGCQYWWRIQAALRREGAYEYLDLREAVKTHARAAAWEWARATQRALLEKLAEEDVRSRFGADLVAMRRDSIEIAFLAWSRAFGEAVHDEVFTSLQGDPVWKRAEHESGAGARARAIAWFERWGKLQTFSSHRAPDLTGHLPLLRLVQQPVEPPGFTLVAENFRRLQTMTWSLSGVNLLIGANGAGKSTALAVLRFFSQALTQGLDFASSQLGAASTLRTWGAPEGAPVRLAIEKGETRWSFSLHPRQGERAPQFTERLEHRGELLFSVNEAGRLIYRDTDMGLLSGECGLAHLLRLKKVDLPLNRVANLVKSIRSYSLPNLHQLKAGGTRPLPERPLESDGGNTFAILMGLKNAPGQEYKYNFVLESLRLAFPTLVGDLGFQTTEHGVQVYVSAPESAAPPLYIGQQADGVLHFLVSIVALASASPGDVVALDQPEDGLHPYAERALLGQLDRWAWEHKLTVILATHSMVLLNEMGGSPEHIFVMKEREEDPSLPVALTDLYTEEWLQGFAIGDLYANENLGSNADEG